MSFFDHPLWAIKARFGIRQAFRMDIMYDDDVRVFIATSEDLPGLICEADTMEELRTQTERVFQDVATFFVRGKNPAWPVLEWPSS